MSGDIFSTTGDPLFEKNELIAMTEARHKLQVELDTWHRIAGEKIAALERERDACRAERDNDAQDIERWIATANKERAEVERLTAERDGLEYGKCQLEQRNAGLLEDNERLKYDIGNATEEKDVALREVERLTRERDALVAELVALFRWEDKSYVHAISHIQNAVLNERADNAVLRTEVERLTRTIAAKERAQQITEAECGDLRDEVERLKALLRDMCMGHGDGCVCRACKEVFRPALGEE